MPGCQKRKRKARLNAIDTTQANGDTRRRRHARTGHAWTHSDSTILRWKTPKRSVGRTFEDEYKSYRVTRGKKGWSWSPDRRGLENPNYVNINSVFATRRVPIGELMTRPIGVI